MRQTLIIAARELRDRKLLFLGAALCAVIVLLIPLLPGARRENPLNVMTTTSLALGLFSIMAATIFLANGTISNLLGERRMSFYLARPLRLGSIWLGKVLGVILTAILISLILVIIPTLLGGGLFALGSFIEDLRAYTVVTGLILANPSLNLPLLLFLLLLLSLFLGLGLRSRTPWLAIDCSTLAAAVGAIWASVQPFTKNAPESTMTNLIVVAVAALLPALAVGNFLGLHRGRIDMQVTHKWTSIATSISVALVAIGFVGWTASIRSFELTEARHAWVGEISPGEQWLAIEADGGPDVATYRKTFLLSPRTGVTHSIHSVEWLHLGDRSALFLRSKAAGNEEVPIERINLETGATSELRVLIDPDDVSAMSLSPDEKYLAWTIDDRLEVIDTRDGSNHLTRRLEHPGWRGWRGWTRLLFLNDREVLVYTRSADDELGWTIHRADLGDGMVASTGSMPPGFFRLSSDGLLLYPRDRHIDIEIRNIETGDLIDTVPRGSRVLPGGKRVSGDARRIEITNLNGNEVRTFSLPTEGQVIGVREPRRGLILLSVASSLADTQTFLVNLATGEAAQIGDNLAIESLGPLAHDRREPGSLGARLLTDRHGGIFLLDPETETVRSLTGHSR